MNVRMILVVLAIVALVAVALPRLGVPLPSLFPGVLPVSVPDGGDAAASSTSGTDEPAAGPVSPTVMF